MDLAQITESLQRDAVWVVFRNVLAQQGGLPVPARLLAALLSATGPLGYFGMIFSVGPAWFMTLVAGFAMGIGYLAGTLGPLVGGGLYAATGNWTMALGVNVGTALPMAVGGHDGTAGTLPSGQIRLMATTIAS